jgi:hypothetical protein
MAEFKLDHLQTKEWLKVLVFLERKAHTLSFDVVPDRLVKKPAFKKLDQFKLRSQKTTNRLYGNSKQVNHLIFAVTPVSIKILNELINYNSGNAPWSDLEGVENIIFYRMDGSILLESITHEGMYFIHLTRDEEGWMREEELVK